MASSWSRCCACAPKADRTSAKAEMTVIFTMPPLSGFGWCTHQPWRCAEAIPTGEGPRRWLAGDRTSGFSLRRETRAATAGVHGVGVLEGEAALAEITLDAVQRDAEQVHRTQRVDQSPDGLND